VSHETFELSIIFRDKFHTLSWSWEAGNLSMTHPDEQMEVAGFSFHLYFILTFLIAASGVSPFPRLGSPEIRWPSISISPVP
jgi:hypothetical protein